MTNAINTKVQYYTGEVRFIDLLEKIKTLVLRPYEDTLSENTWILKHEVAGKSLTLGVKTEKGFEAFIRFSNLLAGRKGYANHILVQYGDDWDESKNDFLTPSLESFWSFGLNSGSSGSSVGIFERPTRTLMRYQISMNNNYIAISIQGDPTFDHAKYYNSFLYFGRIIPFGEDDEDGNIALTCSSTSETTYSNGNIGAISQEEADFYSNSGSDVDKKYGINSSKGMKDISMLRSYTGLPFQKHHVAFLGYGTMVDGAHKGDDEFFSTSKWTDKYHASPAYVTQASDGYRGYLENVIILNPENLLDSDILRENLGTEKDPIYEEYKPIYLQKNITNNFIKNSSCNPNYIVAMRKK